MKQIGGLTMTRIRMEIKEMKLNKTSDIYAQPLKDDLFTWHFTIRGPYGSVFQQGIYHGIIMLPPQYPLFAPSISFLNNNGRFQVGTQICFMNTSYHPQQWGTQWNIRLILQSIRQTFTQKADGLGHIQAASQIRRQFAKQSQKFICDHCGKISQLLPEIKRQLQTKQDKQLISIIKQKQQSKAEQSKAEQVKIQIEYQNDGLQLQKAIQGAILKITELKYCLKPFQ